MVSDTETELERARQRIANLQHELDGALAIIAYTAMQAGELRIPRSALMDNYEVRTEHDLASDDHVIKARRRD